MIEWLDDVSDELDLCNDILTQRTIRNKLRVEISYGQNIEEIFSHKLTPELLLMYKQEHFEFDTEEDNDDCEGEVH
jgi:hypothetical protein